MVLFSVHMTQHMVLSLITPLLLLLGAPVTLALRTLPRGQGAAGAPRALLLDALHSRFARFVSHPLFTVPLFIASLYGVYFTPLFDVADAQPGRAPGHARPLRRHRAAVLRADRRRRTRGRGR